MAVVNFHMWSDGTLYSTAAAFFSSKTARQMLKTLVFNLEKPTATDFSSREPSRISDGKAWEK